jgi:hypothetical protein
MVFNGGLRLRVSFMDGRLQQKPTSQILFIGVFSTNDNAVFFHLPLTPKRKEASYLLPIILYFM